MAGSDLLDKLLDIGVFRVGEFRLKSGVLSPIYVDLRGMIAYPSLIRSMSEAVHAKYTTLDIQTDAVCGVPYTALPIASLYSVLNDVPMVLKRKEAKDYGTKKMVEGVWKKGDNVLILEDIVSSGTSVIETADVLRNEGLKVTDCIVFLNREQGGRENIAKAGIRLHWLFTLNDIFERYCIVNKVEETLVKNVQNYLEGNKYIPVKISVIPKRMSFEDRMKVCQQPVAKRLFEIINEKKSNLCVAVDALTSKDLLGLADKLGPYVCMIKTHIDILTDFTPQVVKDLTSLASKHKYLIFEDRKFADIGNTVKNQYENGMYHIHEWADVVTVHGIPGDGIVTALKSAPQTKACVLIAEMSSEGTLTDEAYQEKISQMGEKHLDCVIGFVGQRRISKKADLINFSPGVSLHSSGDSLGQEYKSPEDAIRHGADVIIVGRGIVCADDPVGMAKEFQRLGYEEYLKLS